MEISGRAPDFGGRIRFLHRLEDGARSRSKSGDTYDAPQGWLRLERRGSVFSAASSPDGIEFTVVHEQEIERLPDSLLVGIAAAARDIEPGERFRPMQASIANLSFGSDTPRFLRGDCNADG